MAMQPPALCNAASRTGVGSTTEITDTSDHTRNNICRDLSNFKFFRPFTKVPSLVFDLELEENNNRSSSVEEQEAFEVAQDILSLVKPHNSTELRLSMAMASILHDSSERPVRLKTSEVAARLFSMGYRVQIRTALGGGAGGECLRNLRHTFLCCSPSQTVKSGGWFVVDMHFREQFEIAHPTARYAAVLSAVPEILVVGEAKVAPLVETMCQEMARAFKQQNEVLPPWRQVGSMLSKWRPRRSMDEAVGKPESKGLQPFTGKAYDSQTAANRKVTKKIGYSEPRTILFGGNFVPVPGDALRA